MFATSKVDMLEPHLGTFAVGVIVAWARNVDALNSVDRTALVAAGIITHAGIAAAMRHGVVTLSDVATPNWCR